MRVASPRRARSRASWESAQGLALTALRYYSDYQVCGLLAEAVHSKVADFAATVASHFLIGLPLTVGSLYCLEGLPLRLRPARRLLAQTGRRHPLHQRLHVPHQAQMPDSTDEIRCGDKYGPPAPRAPAPCRPIRTSARCKPEDSQDVQMYTTLLRLTVTTLLGIPTCSGNRSGAG